MQFHRHPGRHPVRGYGIPLFRLADGVRVSVQRPVQRRPGGVADHTGRPAGHGGGRPAGGQRLLGAVPRRSGAGVGQGIRRLSQEQRRYGRQQELRRGHGSAGGLFRIKNIPLGQLA